MVHTPAGCAPPRPTRMHRNLPYLYLSYSSLSSVLHPTKRFDTALYTAAGCASYSSSRSEMHSCITLVAGPKLLLPGLLLLLLSRAAFWPRLLAVPALLVAEDAEDAELAAVLARWDVAAAAAASAGLGDDAEPVLAAAFLAAGLLAALPDVEALADPALPTAFETAGAPIRAVGVGLVAP